MQTQNNPKNKQVLRVVIDERSVTFSFVWAFMWRFFILYIVSVLAIAVPIGVMSVALERQYPTPQTQQQFGGNYK